uniref:Uncharacterized protein n=1 Tax=Anguilla anguilla TaxID=7936 RepID=A0A0E9WRP3_ANGAN
MPKVSKILENYEVHSLPLSSWCITINFPPSKKIMVTVEYQFICSNFDDNN